MKLETGNAWRVFVAIGCLWPAVGARADNGIMVTGRVVSGEGTVVDAATIVVNDDTTFYHHFDRSGNAPPRFGDNTRVVPCAANGEFEFIATPPYFTMYGFHPEAGAGLATETTLKDSTDVILRPWGRIEGTAKRGNTLLTNHRVKISYTAPRIRRRDEADPYAIVPRVDLYFTVETDAEGRFVFDKVPSGDAVIGAEENRDDAWSAFQPMLPIDVLPGRTNWIDVGGSGRTVHGRLRIAEESAPGFSMESCLATLYPAQPEIPTEIVVKGLEAYRAWKREWNRSEKGKAYQALMSYGRSIPLSKDGSFEVYDLPSGRFSINVQVLDSRLVETSPGLTNWLPGEVVAFTNVDFEVQQEAGAVGRPLDIGTTEIQVRIPLRVGDPAPDFECPTLDGGTFHLSEQGGKFVLLDFWATWCGPCKRETPSLKRVYEAFGEDPRFEMIGLSLDDRRDEPAQYARENEIGWTQGFLGKWSEDEIAKAYGVIGIPAVFLIGPDGRVLAKKLRGRFMMDEVSAALGNAASETNSPARASGSSGSGTRVEDE